MTTPLSFWTCIITLGLWPKVISTLFFKVLQFQKIIVAAATIWGNMVFGCYVILKGNANCMARMVLCSYLVVYYFLEIKTQFAPREVFVFRKDFFWHGIWVLNSHGLVSIGSSFIAAYFIDTIQHFLSKLGRKPPTLILFYKQRLIKETSCTFLDFIQWLLIFWEKMLSCCLKKF